MAPAKRQKRDQRPRFSPRQRTALVEEAIIDAYGESEQRVRFLTMLEEHLACPFTTAILGIPVLCRTRGSQRRRGDRRGLPSGVGTTAHSDTQSPPALTTTGWLGVDCRVPLLGARLSVI